MKKIIIFIIIIIVLILLVGYFIIRRINVLDKTGMVNREYLKVIYSASGDSNGNVDYIELDFKDKKLRTRYAENHMVDIEEKEFNVTDDDIDEIISYLNSNNIIKLSECKNEEGLFPLDGPMISLSIICSDKTYNIDWYCDFSKKERDNLRNLTKKMYNLQK